MKKEVSNKSISVTISGENDSLLLKDSLEFPDLFGIFLLGVSGNVGYNVFLLGISYFSHSVYHSAAIFLSICVAIYLPATLASCLQLFFDHIFDIWCGSETSYTFRIVCCLLSIIFFNTFVVTLNGMFPGADGAIPSANAENNILFVISIISFFSFALNGSMYQFISFSDSSGKALAAFTLGAQASGVITSILAFIFQFDQDASTDSVTGLWLFISALLMACLAYFNQLSRKRLFFRYSMRLKDKAFQSEEPPILLGDVFNEILSLSLTIGSSTFLLPFYVRFQTTYASTHQWLVVVKLVFDASSRLVAIRIVPSEETLLRLSLSRFLFLVVFLAMLTGFIPTPNDLILISIIAIWAFTSGLCVSWSYFLAAGKMKSKDSKSKAGAYLNFFFNLSLGLSVLASGACSDMIFLGSDMK